MQRSESVVLPNTDLVVDIDYFVEMPEPDIGANGFCHVESVQINGIDIIDALSSETIEEMELKLEEEYF